MSWELSNSWEWWVARYKQCEDCALGKAKQRAVGKKAVPRSQVSGERLFFDISSPTTPTFGGKHHWLLVIDNCSNYCWSLFLREKSDLAQTMLGLINTLKIKFHLQVQCFHCIDVGKNQAFKKLQPGRAGDQLWIYSPRYSSAKWSSQMQVCYPIQPGTCHAQPWKI